MLQKLLTWIGIIIAVMWLIKNPDQAASLAHQVAHAISTFANGL